MTSHARQHGRRSAVVVTAVLAGLVVGTLSTAAAVDAVSGGDVGEVAPNIDVTYTFDSITDAPGGLVVVDDAGAPDSQRRELESIAPGVFGLPELPGPGWVILGLGGLIGGGAGYMYGRRHCGDFLLLGGRGSSTSGVTAHATGTFETPRDSGTVAVSGLDFEPDLLLFTATNNATADGPALDRTDGWTYGKAKVDEDGVTQNVVSVANDARRSDAAVAGARTDAAVDLEVHDEESVGRLLGTVEATTPEGFEVSFDASALPDEHADDSYVVAYRAFATAADTDVEVGYFATPEEAAVQTVGLGTDADYVLLTAVDPLGEMDAIEVTDGRIGVSHGVAAGTEAIDQHATSGAVEDAAVGHDTHAAFDDRAINLVHGSGGEVDGRTSARVTGLGEDIQLTYDEVYDGSEEDGAGAAARQTTADPAASGKTADGAAGDPPRLVTFVAVNAGDGQAPDVGHFELPAPEQGPKRVDVGFEPSVLEFTASPADDVGSERTVATSPLSFGWSHGTATIDRSGTVRHHVLHSSVPRDRVAGSGPVETPLTREPTDEHSDAGAASPDGGTAAGGADGGETAGEIGPTESPGAGAIVLAVDDGRIRGREEVRVMAVDRTGFEVETERLGPSPGSADDRRPVVFYTAWAGSDDA